MIQRMPNNKLDIGLRIRDDIIGWALRFGQRITIDALATRYGVSHMPVREALRELRGEGLVVIEPNRGARVRTNYGYGPARFAGVANDHGHLINALAAHDQEAAALLMGAHATKAKLELLARIETQTAHDIGAKRKRA